MAATRRGDDLQDNLREEWGTNVKVKDMTPSAHLNVKLCCTGTCVLDHPVGRLSLWLLFHLNWQPALRGP